MAAWIWLLVTATVIKPMLRFLERGHEAGRGAGRVGADDNRALDEVGSVPGQMARLHGLRQLGECGL